MAIIKKKTMEEDMGKLELSYIAEGNVDWCSQVGKSFGSSMSGLP